MSHFVLALLVFSIKDVFLYSSVIFTWYINYLYRRGTKSHPYLHLDLFLKDPIIDGRALLYVL